VFGTLISLECDRCLFSWLSRPLTHGCYTAADVLETHETCCIALAAHIPGQMATTAIREQPQVLSLEDSFQHDAPQPAYNGGFMSPDSYEDLMWQGLGSDSGDDFRHPTERAAELIQQLVSPADCPYTDAVPASTPHLT
jgi:hypothetical protein